MDREPGERELYFAETEPEKRLRHLEKWEQDSPGEAVRFARQLWQERYTDPKKPDRMVDNWLWKCVYLPGLFKRQNVSRKAFRTELDRTIHELHLESGENLGKDLREVLYLEFRNMAARYLETCRGSRYASRYFGLMKAEEKDKQEKAAEEFWMMSRGLALISGKKTEMKLFSEALEAELEDFAPDYRETYRSLDARFLAKNRS